MAKIVGTAADGKPIYELPEHSYDLLLKLWARSQGMEIVSVKKIPKEEAGHRLLEEGREMK
ncbi:MAG: hypothetical protein LUC98_08680 [Lachnospiraceae bacterium]|nr:hypothetical protein [Lachnospiraceae bacterium]